MYAVCLLGSPPQVRGKPDTPADDTETDRITPAGAGKTGSGGLHAENLGDHPRRCGENYIDELSEIPESGSPPQVRGKQPILGINVHAVRITPAGAGKTI